MFAVTTPDTPEHRLRGAVLRCNVAATTTPLAGVPMIDLHQDSPAPLRFVVQLTDKLTPTLFEYAAVQSGLGLHVHTGILRRALGALGHITNLQVLHHYLSVVFADSSGELMQEIIALVAYADVDAPKPSLGLLPVRASLAPTGKDALLLALRTFELRERTGLHPLAGTERYHVGNTKVDAYGGAGRGGKVFYNLTAKGRKPVFATPRYRHVFDGSMHLARKPKLYFPNFGKAQVVPAKRKTLWKTHSVMFALLLEAGIPRALEEALKGFIQVPERLLQAL